MAVVSTCVPNLFGKNILCSCRRTCSAGVGRSYVRSSLRVQPFTSGQQLLSGKDRLWDSDFTSLESRAGFLRSAKEYNPPPNVTDLVTSICSKLLGAKKSIDTDDPLGDGIVRFKILTTCIEHFKHDIPNYELHKLITVGDLVSYFERNVQAKNPYDALCSRAANDLESLPPNLNVQADYVRFHPDTDTAFGGVSAFPMRSTIVTGLRYKKKYRGHTAKNVLSNDE